jgi:hypothetical protein
MKNINWQDDRDIFGRMLLLTGNQTFKYLRDSVDNFNADLTDALSIGQLKSKRWLVDELEKQNLDLGIVFLCAGWYATLAAMLFNSSCKLEKIRSFDIDLECALIADCINRSQVLDNWRFKASTADIKTLNYSNCNYTVLRSNGTTCELSDSPTTIVNTSCEHIENFDFWYNQIPKGKIVVLQTNNYFDITDHVNCSSILEEFANQTPMATVLYSNELDLGRYKRFMRIGIK